MPKPTHRPRSPRAQAHYKTLLHTLLHTLLLALPLLTTFPTAHATGRSFDACKDQTQCADPYACYMYNTDTASYVFCPPTEGVKCFCQLIAETILTTCAVPSDCSDARETCAVDPEGRKYCASCDALAQPEPPFGLKPVSESDTTCATLPTRTPNPSPTPVSTTFGSSLDFCTVESAHCEGGPGKIPNCHDGEGQKCQVIDTRCQCFESNMSCESSEDCQESDRCVTDVRNGQMQCASCLIVDQDVYLLPVDTATSACKEEVEDASTLYPRGPNGFNSDACSADSQCQSPRTCVSFIDSETFIACPNTEEASCICQNGLDRPYCESSDNCPVGELCATFPKLPNPTCLSAAFVRALGTLRSKVLGERALPTPSGSPGLSQESCRFDWDCVAPRRCKHVSKSFLFGHCAGREPCVCERILPAPCKSLEDCDDGEVCAKIIGSKVGAFCVAKGVVAADRFLEGIDEVSPNSEDVEESEQSLDAQNTTAPRQGLTGNDCKFKRDCAVGRICRHITERGDLPCDGRRGCTCEYADEVAACEDSKACDEGELCVEIKQDVRWNRNATCRSEGAIELDRLGRYIEYFPPVPSAEPPATETGNTSIESDAVCIDAGAIEHLPASERVFASARRAIVLCDENLSCATHGHVVVWRERAMMMQTYCAQVGHCTRRRIAVNSPKMRRKVRIPSRTQGLMFTAFAARYASTWEERVLTSLVHIGL